MVYAGSLNKNLVARLQAMGCPAIGLSGAEPAPAARFDGTAWWGTINPILADGESIVGISWTATSQGYWMFTSAGRVFPFGDAGFFGDLEQLDVVPALPVKGGVATVAGDGYWLFAEDGGIFAFGAAGFHGSVPGALAGTGAFPLVFARLARRDAASKLPPGA